MYDFISKKSWKILHTALTWGQTNIMFPVRKQNVGCTSHDFYKDKKKKCNTKVANTGHRLLSAENRKANPTLWCTPQICPGPMLKSSEITILLNFPCSYSNTCIVNLFSGPLFKKTHTRCSTYVTQYSVEAVRMMGEFSWMSTVFPGP